jgi:hypothetical protein
MHRVSILALAAAGALASVSPSAIGADADLKALREEIAQMKNAYEQRINALEKRLAQAESTSTQAKAAADKATTQTARAGEGKASGFNPEIGLNLQAALTSTRINPSSWTLQGFAPAGEPDELGPPRRRNFSLGETELTVAANIDPNFRGFLNLALTPENSIELEEAYVQTLGLGGGFTIKGGRFLSGIGYNNEIHPHAWDFADAPLAYAAFFGNKLTAEGVQVKWLAPTENFLELGFEAARDDAFPGGARNLGSGGLGTAFARLGGDVGASNSWRAGISHVATNPHERGYDGEDAAASPTRVLFGGKSRTTGLDFVWKWAPNGNAKERSFKLQAEYFRRQEDGRLTCRERDSSGACGGSAGITDSYSSRQTGYYAQGVWQFMPAWRVGYRYDKLDSGTPNFGPTLVATDLPQLASWKPTRNTVMVDYATSEFARLRFQFARDTSRGAGRTDNQLWLQYVMSLGAHGAHKF